MAVIFWTSATVMSFPAMVATTFCGSSAGAWAHKETDRVGSEQGLFQAHGFSQITTMIHLDGSGGKQFGVIVAGMRRRLGWVCVAAAAPRSDAGTCLGPSRRPYSASLSRISGPTGCRRSSICPMRTPRRTLSRTSPRTRPPRGAGPGRIRPCECGCAPPRIFAIPSISPSRKSCCCKTGPLTISFLVNDRVLDRVRYDHDGVQHFEKPVPAGWVTAGQDVTVGADIDKPWTPPDGGPKLGIILMRIGLTQ